MELTFEHDEAAHQYRLLGDGTTVSIADYRRLDDGRTLVFHHTLTEPRFRDRGYAALLVAHALDDVRASRGQVVATCWFVEQFLDAHPGYADLRAE